MYGFIAPCRRILTRDEYQHLKANYCGLCRELDNEYGVLARALCTHEANLLQLMADCLTAREPSVNSCRCPLPPFRKVRSAKSTAVGQFAAAISILLFAAKLRDDIHDGGGLTPRFALRLSATRIAKARVIACRSGFDASIVERAVGWQHELEKRVNGNSLRALCEPTGTLLGAIFSHTAILSSRAESVSVLHDIGYHLGHIIYLLDAFADKKRDEKRGRFNPLIGIERKLPSAQECKVGSKHALSSAVRLLDRSAESLSESTGRLGFSSRTRIIHSTLSEGLLEKARKAICNLLEAGQSRSTNRAFGTAPLGIVAPFLFSSHGSDDSSNHCSCCCCVDCCDTCCECCDTACWD